MIRGIFTIEIVNKNTGDIKVIKKENAVNPYYKKMFNVNDIPNRFTLASENEVPLTDGAGNITVPSYILYTNVYVYDMYNNPAISSVYNYSYGLTYQSISKTSELLDEIGKHSFFNTDYFEGPFNLNGIILSKEWWSNVGSYDERYFERLFSCLDITPSISITDEEKVKFYYEFVQEW